MQRLELVDGSMLTTAQLAGKPAAYLFWATWCHVCRTELPLYQRLHTMHSGSGFRVIAVSLDETAGPVRDFVSEQRYTLPVMMRSDTLRRIFGPIMGTPTLFLVDREGRIVFKHLGNIDEKDLDARIRLML